MEEGIRRRLFAAQDVWIKGVHAFASADDPNAIVIMGEYESHDKAREMFQTQEFRDITQKAGVIGAPEVVYLTSVADMAA